MRSDLRAFSSGVVVFLLSTTAGAAHAQSTPSDASSNQDIVVTANKREQRIVDVPAAVTAVSGDALVARNITRVEELTSQTPGLSIETRNGGLRPIIRGLNTGSAGSTTAIIIDEVPVSHASSLAQGSVDIGNFDTYDLQRIEVLRGPQGTLYGATAQGGLIKYVTNEPKLSAIEGSAQGAVEQVKGGEVGFSARGMVNVPVVDDQLAIRVVGFYDAVPGFIDNPLANRRDSDRGARWGFRAQLLWQASDDIRVRLTAANQRDTRDDNTVVEVIGATQTPAAPPANAYEIANGGRLVSNSREREGYERRYDYYSGLINWSLDIADITSVSSYAIVRSRSIVDTSFFNLAPGLTTGILFGRAYGQPSVTFINDSVSSLKKFNQEIRLASKPNFAIGGLRVDWQIGGFYSDEDILLAPSYDFYSITEPRQILTTPIGAGSARLPGSYRETAGFGDVTLHLSDRLELSGGVRYARNKQRNQVFNFRGLIFGPVDVVNPQIRSTDSKLTWSSALRYRPTDNTALYLRAASGYRPGGPVLLPPAAPASVPRTYGPDNTVNYEAGFKGEAFGGLLSFDVAVFRIDWTDVQVNTLYVDPATNTPFTITSNAGKARSQGVEWSFAARPMRGLTIGWLGSVIDAKLTQDAPGLGGRSGDKLPYVPEFTSTLDGEYRAAIGGVQTAFIGAAWQHVGTRFGGFSTSAGVTNHPRLPTYDQINLRAGVDFRRLTLEAYVTNLGNSRGITRYSSDLGFNGTGTAEIIRPRTIGLRVSAQY